MPKLNYLTNKSNFFHKHTIKFIVECSLKILITLLTIGLGILRLWKPDLAIDSITVALIVIAILPWAGSIFKTIELPGGLKVGYHEIKEIQQKAEDIGLIQPRNRNDESTPTYTFEKISHEDNNLVLAGLRIEIEYKLQELASLYDIPQQKFSARGLAEKLGECEILNNSEASVLMDLLPLLNKAVHGAKVDREAYQVALNMGKDILNTLDKRTQTPKNHP